MRRRQRWLLQGGEQPRTRVHERHQQNGVDAQLCGEQCQARVAPVLAGLLGRLGSVVGLFVVGSVTFRLRSALRGPPLSGLGCELHALQPAVPRAHASSQLLQHAQQQAAALAKGLHLRSGQNLFAFLVFAGTGVAVA